MKTEKQFIVAAGESVEIAPGEIVTVQRSNSGILGITKTPIDPTVEIMTTPQTDAQEKELKDWRPEPWILEADGTIRFANGEHLGDGANGGWIAGIRGRANAQRAVQCVNACASISDPQSAIDAAREALRLAIQNLPTGDHPLTLVELRKALALLEGKS